MRDADFAALLASAWEGAQLARGVPVAGARAWRVAPDAAPVEVPLADVAPAPSAPPTRPA